MTQVYFAELKSKWVSSYSADLLDKIDSGEYVVKGLFGTQIFRSLKELGRIKELKEAYRASLDSIAKSRREIRARTVLEAGIKKWGWNNLKFLTLTLYEEMAAFSNTYVAGGFRGCISALVKRLRRDFGLFEYCGIKVKNVSEGVWHLHMMVKCGWISQRYLSDLWEELTYCPVLDIRSFRYNRGLRNYLARYCSNQGRLGYSRNWVYSGWRFMTERIFRALKYRNLPYKYAAPYCMNIWLRYVWYRRLLPYWTRMFYRDLFPRMLNISLPVYYGNWEPDPGCPVLRWVRYV